MPYLHYISHMVCPHCRSTADQSVLYAHAEVKSVTEGAHTRWEQRADRIRAFVSCRTCHQPWMLVLERRDMVQGKRISQDADMHVSFLNRIRPAEVVFECGNARHVAYTITGDKQAGRDISYLYRVVEQYPESTLQRPERDLLPPSLNEAFDELEDILSQPRFVMIGCRRILEIATSDKLATPKPTLAERIGQLQAQGLLTREIADWSRALKDILNGKTHEGSAPSRELADEVLDFTRLLIELLYVYPAKIGKMKHQPTPPEAD